MTPARAAAFVAFLAGACLSCIAPPAALAQQGAAEARPDPRIENQYLGPGRRKKPRDICMDEREQKAEALVRSGIVIREYARECLRQGWDGGLLDLWNTFENANGEQIKAAVRLRDDAFLRNYPENPQATRQSDSIVLASRNISRMAPAECTALRKVVTDFKDYNDFVRFSAITELGLVRNSITLCKTRQNRGNK